MTGTSFESYKTSNQKHGVGRVFAFDDLEGNLVSRPRPFSAVAKKRQRPQSASLQRSRHRQYSPNNFKQENYGSISAERGIVLEVEKAVSRLSSLPSSASAIRVLRTLRDAYEAFQIQGEHMHIHALECLSHACEIKCQLLGSKNKWTKASIADYVKCCNIVGTQLISKGCPELGSKVLQKALATNTSDIRAQQATIVNTAVCLFSQGFYEDSIKYLSSIIKNQCSLKEKKRASSCSSESTFIGETHLNLSAAYYYLHDLKHALWHAQCAVRACQERVRVAMKTPQYSLQYFDSSDDSKVAYTPRLSSTRKQQLKWKATYRLSAEALRKGEIREALIALALSYLSLGKALLATATQSFKTRVDQGLKWHRKAYEEVACIKPDLFPTHLCRTLWIVYVQACFQFYRSIASPDDKEILFARKHAAAMWVQRVFRSYLKRKHLALKIVSTLLLQRTIRTYLCKQRKLRKDSAIKLQAFVRKGKAQNEYNDILDLAITMQSLWRGCHQRKNYAQIKPQVISATQVLQHHLRSYTNRMKLKNEKEKRRHRAIQIQSKVRQYQSKQKVLRMRQERAIEKLQSCYRGHKTRTVCKKRKKSCILVQSSYRRYSKRKHIKPLLSISNGGRILKFVYERHILLLAFSRLLENMNEARKNIKTSSQRQINFVRHMVLMQWINIERVRLDSAIQKWKQVTLEIRREMTQEDKAIVVQACWRRSRESKRFQESRGAAIIIQKQLRKGYLETCRSRNVELNQISKKILAIQAVRILQNKHRQYLQHTRAATVIQSQCRGHQTRKVILNAEQNFDNAVVTIQKHYRGNKIRRQYREEKTKRVAQRAEKIMGKQQIGSGKRKNRNDIKNRNEKRKNRILVLKEKCALRSIRTSVIKT